MKAKYVASEDGDVAYLYLPSHKGEGNPCVNKQLRLLETLDNYNGPDIYLDFDDNGVLVGLEVLFDNNEDISNE
jgi:uncharacterized protein YuzE